MFNRKNLLKNRGQLLITFGTLGSPTCGFHLLLFSAGTPSAFMPALFTIYSFPQVHFPLSYLRFSPFRLFRRYASRFHTCAFHRLGFSAGTLSAFIPALLTVPAFPQVHFPLSYLRFSPFRFSAGTLSSFIPALFTVPAFPQVHLPLSYLRFSPFRLFRRYTFLFHTCAFHRLGFSAGTLPASIPALFIIYSFPQVLFRLVFHDAFLKIKTSDLAVLNAEGGILLVGHLMEVGLHRTGNAVMCHEQISLFLRLRP